MSGPDFIAGLWMQAFAFIGAAFALTGAIGAALVRSLFAVLAFMMIAALGVAIGLVALGAAGPGLAVVLIAACFAAALMLGGVLLTARAAKERPAKGRLALLALAPLGVGAILWGLLGRAPPAPLGAADASPILLMALAAIVIAGAAATLGLVGLDPRAAKTER